MNRPLTAEEIDQIRGLVRLLYDGQISPDEAAELRRWVETDEDAAWIYAQYMNLFAGLHWDRMQEAETEGPQTLGPEPTASPTLGWLGQAFRSGADFLSQSFVLTLLVAIGLPGLILAILFVSIGHQPIEPAPVAVAAAPEAVAEITRLRRCEWGENSKDFVAGTRLFSGQEIRLLSGLAEVTFVDGARVIMEGPATFRPGGRGQGFLQAGRLVANVSNGAKGFSITTPTMAIVDVGTEFGVEASATTGEVVVEVLQGQVDVNLLARSGRLGVGRRLRRGQRILASEGQYMPAPATSFVRDFPPADALDVPAEYVRAVKRAVPVAYWRFETRQDGRVPNETGPDGAGQLIGPVSLGGWERNHTLSLPAVNVDRCMVVDPAIAGLAGKNYSVECWMRVDRGGQDAMIFAAVVGSLEGVDLQKNIVHACMVQLGTGPPESRPDVIRFCHRNPAGIDGGTDVFSETSYQLKKWQHVVAVKDDWSVRLYVDGRCVSRARDRKPLAAFDRIIVGQRLLTHNTGKKKHMRYFVGQLDEMAVYNRALSPEEVLRHYELLKPNR